MSEKKHGTGITWTHWPGTKGETWTVVRGCQLARYRLPNGREKSFKTCVGCYAMVQAHSLVKRFDMPQYRGLTKESTGGPIWNGKVFFDEEQLEWPLHCLKPRTFFLTSMGDIAYEGVNDDQIARVFAIMVVCGLRKLGHNFLPLTKRPDRIAELFKTRAFMVAVADYVGENFLDHVDDSDIASQLFDGRIWWGTSIEDEASAEWAIGHLQDIPAPGRRWISYEPMIEPFNLDIYIKSLSWVVIGGASKQRNVAAFPFDVDAAFLMTQMCRHYGVPVYIKQLGARPVNNFGEMWEMEVSTNHNDDPKYWPEPLRVQEFPNAHPASARP